MMKPQISLITLKNQLKNLIKNFKPRAGLGKRGPITVIIPVRSNKEYFF